MDTLPFEAAIEHAEREYRKPVAWLFTRAQQRAIATDKELIQVHYAVEVIWADNGLKVTLLGIPIEVVDEPTHEPMLRTDADGQRRLLNPDGSEFRLPRDISESAGACLTAAHRHSEPILPIPVCGAKGLPA